MKISSILEILEGNVVCGFDRLNDEVEVGFASDLMSDVLTLQTTNMLLITGLANLQTIRTAEMADISVVVMARNKKTSTDILALATELNMIIIECRYSMFKTCGLLFQSGLKAIY
jgi:hypothetical protein